MPDLEHYLAEVDLAQDYPEAEDFGAGLLEEATPSHLQVLAADAVCRATLHLADRLGRGLLPPGHLEAGPVMEQQLPDAGPPRLHFRGQDHPLGGNAFTLGRDPRCDLVFDTTEFPSVSARHCEVVPDARGYTVVDSSRFGTLVNNRPVPQQRPLQPGDWIRLGPGGPLLRYLGRAQDKRQLLPTA
jgi:hypothetical protein